MEDKEKQIEEMRIQRKLEMTKDISNGLCGVLAYEIQKLAEHLISLNYVKLPKDSVVLSREEYDNLKLEIQNAHNKGAQAGFDMTKFKEESIKRKASKETAEKYKVAMMLSIQEMQKYLEITEEQAKILYHHNSEIAKQFMVEET